jgi:xylulokinase
MSDDAFLGLDIGGTSAKAGVVDVNGNLLGMAHRAYHPQITEDGRVEIPIATIYSAAREATVDAVRQSGARIAALSISSQGQTFVSLDEHDEPLHPAIVWYDARASEQARRLARALQSVEIHEPPPLVEAIATAPKIMWLREHHSSLMARARRYLLLPDYFAYRLGGRAVIDPCTAASTALYAEDATDYCAAAMEHAGIAKAQLAEIAATGSPIARVREECVGEWGLDAGTLLVTGTNDQYAGALGAGNCRPGIVSVTSGTCLALVTLTNRLPEPLPPGLAGGRFPICRYQFALAYSKTAGVVLDWFRRELGAGEGVSELDALASQVPVGSRGVTMLPHFDGMVSPAPDPAARGAFLNLSLHHTRADMYRAILEALGFNLRENIELLRQSGFALDTVRAIGGAARSDVWLQIMADVLGSPVERPAVAEAAVLGAAIIAAVGAGAYSSLEAGSQALYRAARVFTPDPDRHARYNALFDQYTRLYRHVYGFRM